MLREVEKAKLTDISQFYNDCMDMFCYFNAKNIDALVQSNKMSLEMLRKRDGISLCVPTGSRTETPFSKLAETQSTNWFCLFASRSSQSEGEQMTPLFATNMVLNIPRMVISPTLDDANNAFNNVLLNVVEVNKAVRMWGLPSDPSQPSDLESPSQGAWRGTVISGGTA